MRTLSPREARLIAILVLLALVALAYLAVIQPILSGFAERADQRQQLQMRFAANERMIAAIPRLRRQAESQNRLVPRFALTAANPGAASELLRDRLQASVAAAGGDFRGGEDLAVAGGMVGTRINARLTAAQLNILVAQIQNSSPLITITALTIGADDALVTGRAETLDVQIEASVPYRPAQSR